MYGLPERISALFVVCLYICVFVCVCVAIGNPIIRRGELGSINQFYHATYMYLSQSRTWISNVMYRCVFMILDCWWEKIICFVIIGEIVYDHRLNFLKRRLFCWYWWNCLRSLFKLSLEAIVRIDIVRYWWTCSPPLYFFLSSFSSWICKQFLSLCKITKNLPTISLSIII